MGKKKAINNRKKTFRLQFLFYALVFINFLFCNFFMGKNLNGEKMKKSKHLGFQA